MPALPAADFAAKVRWRMQHDRNPMLVVTQDKYLVRGHARSRGVATARLIHVAERVESMPFAALPSDCMIKASHGCGWNILRTGGAFFDYANGADFGAGADGRGMRSTQAPLSAEEVAATCRHWLRQNYSPGEWAYTRMKPRILAEELLQSRRGGELMDFRCYAFDGVVKAISVGSPSYRRDKLNVFFDPDWTPIRLTRYRERLPDPLPAKPDVLREMLEAAARLGRGLDFARIDLYDTTKGVVVGEMTAYPEAGHAEAPSGCPHLNRWLGKQWKVPLRNKWSWWKHVFSNRAVKAGQL
jgi:hypothetical protein